MGHRANFAIVEGDEYSLYYSHWAAITVPRDLFWGSGHALNFIRAQREVDESGWLDDVWCEGAALIDCDKQLLLLFGGEEIPYDIPLRREYLKLLQNVWSPWKVRWANEGIADLARYVRYPVENVQTSVDRQDEFENLDPPDQLDWTDTVGSIRFADDSLRFFPLPQEVEAYLMAGAPLAMRCGPTDGLTELHLEPSSEGSFPHGGFHLDLVERTLDFWTTTVYGNRLQIVNDAWPGWTVKWQRDKFESQLKATEGRLTLPVRPKKELRAQLKELLLRDAGSSPVNMIQQITQQQRDEGKDVQVNPFALQDDRVEMSRSQREEILNTALGVKT